MYQLYNYVLWAICLCVSNYLYSQTGHYKNGAGAFAKADASVTDSDSWSLFNNVGALANREQEISVIFSYRNFHSIQNLYSTAAGMNCPVGSFNAALGFFRFGNDLFNEQSIIFGTGHKIGHTSIGISLHYIQFQGEQIGRGECLAISFGGLTRINQELTLGAYIFNLNQVKISRITGEKLPTVMNLGIEYKTGNLRANLETEKEIDFKVTIRSGIEYAFKQRFFIRTGIITNPFSSSYGLGLLSGRFIIDYGLRRSGTLGMSHMMTVVFRIKSN
ncbi:hypothetical protein ACFLU5_12275 [Bacteroidota bacterium]